MTDDALWIDGLYELHALHERDHWWFRGRRQIVKAVTDRILAKVKDPLVVDVGCGTGANVAAFASDYRAVGIDPSTHAVQLAQRLFPQLHFIAGHAPEDLGNIAAQADLFLLMDVLEHVRDDFDLFSRILAAAKPGSHVLITVPADESLWSEHDVTLGHFRRYTTKRLRAVWEGLPVTVRLFSHFNAKLYPLIKLARRVAALRGKSLGYEGTDQKTPAPPINRLLQHTFTGETGPLLAAVDRSAPAYHHGVSLFVVLRRGPGRIEPRSRPADIEPDRSYPDLESLETRDTRP